MHYFAYGSNMSLARLRARVPSARAITRATLSQHALRFHKHSLVDNSAKCDAFFTGNRHDEVLGVLFKMAPQERAFLDAAEGLHAGYEIKDVQITTHSGDTMTAFTYYATHINTALKPYSWYLHHVLTGAREAGLPTSYLQTLQAITTLEDPDMARAARERALHAKG